MMEAAQKCARRGAGAFRLQSKQNIKWMNQNKMHNIWSYFSFLDKWGVSLLSSFAVCTFSAGSVCQNESRHSRSLESDKRRALISKLRWFPSAPL